MVGLSAAELQAETLFPGDTIEYFSMAFVAGDKRGHRVSKVLRIDRRDEDFPIRVDTQEMLPLTILVKRVRDRNDFEISSEDAKWRKLRTFKLVDGEVEGETRADRLNAGLKQVLSGAREATKKQLAREKQEKANAAGKKLMSSFFTTTVRSERDDVLSPDSPSPERKPLTPRENRAPSSKSLHHYRDVPKKRREREKEPPSERRPQSAASKHASYKRKRDVTPTKPSKRSDKSRHNPQKSISKFFNREQPRSKSKTDLNKFMKHIEEKKQGASLNEYMKLDEQQQHIIEKTVKSAGGNQDAVKNSKAKWDEQRKKFRVKSAGTITSWIQQAGRNGLEKASAGDSSSRNDPFQSPKKANKGKQRLLDLGPDKPTPPKMHRRDLDFKMTDDLSSKEFKVKHSGKHHAGHGAKHGRQHQKYRGSLGSQSVKVH